MPSLNATMTPAEVAAWERQLTAPRVYAPHQPRRRLPAAKPAAMTQREQAAVVDALMGMHRGT